MEDSKWPRLQIDTENFPKLWRCKIYEISETKVTKVELKRLAQIIKLNLQIEHQEEKQQQQYRKKQICKQSNRELRYLSSKLELEIKIFTDSRV